MFKDASSAVGKGIKKVWKAKQKQGNSATSKKDKFKKHNMTIAEQNKGMADLGLKLTYATESLGESTYLDELEHMTDSKWDPLKNRIKTQIKLRKPMFDGDTQTIADHYALRIMKGKQVEPSAPPAEKEEIKAEVPPDNEGDDSDDDESDDEDEKGIDKTILSKNPFKISEVKPVEKEGKKGYLIDAFDSRQIKVQMKTYKFPLLEFKGIWNSTALGSGPLPFAKHFGMHIRSGDYVEFDLPSTLVDELMTHWVGHSRDSDFGHYMVSVIRCRYLLRFVKNMTASQIMTAVQYGPALAYCLSWRRDQNVSRVVKRAFWSRKQIVALSMLTTALSAATICLSSLFLSAVLAPLGIIGLLGSAYLMFIKGKSAARPDHITKLQSAGPVFEEKPVRKDLLDVMKRVMPRYDKPSEKTKIDLHLVGIACKSHIPTTYKSTPGNEQECLEKRVFVEQFVPEADIEKEILTFIDSNMQLLCGPRLRVKSLPIPIWINNCGASPEVKAKYRMAYEQLQAEGITQNSHLSNSQIKDYCKVSMFIKEETLNGSGLLGETTKAPRAIQPSSPKFMILVGPWVAAVQAHLKTQWSCKNSHSVWSAGESVTECAKHVEPRPGYKGYSKDFGKFDARQQKVHHDMETKLLDWFDAPMAVRQLHAGTKRCVGLTTRGWKYVVEYQRKSGHPWTSLFNTWLNKVMSAFCWCKSLGKTYLDIMTLYDELCNGDDGIGQCPIDWPTSEYAVLHKKLGMDLEIECSMIMSDLTYCSMRWTESKEGPTFYPLIGKVLTKIAWTLKENDATLEHMKGVLLSMWNSFQVCPPLEAYARICLAKLGHIQAVEVKGEQHKMACHKPCTASDETWFNLERIYGWTHDCQKRFEKFLESATIPSLSDNAEFELLCDHDCMVGSEFTPYNATPFFYANTGDLDAAAKAHNKLMHAKNGNLDALRNFHAHVYALVGIKFASTQESEIEEAEQLAALSRSMNMQVLAASAETAKGILQRYEGMVNDIAASHLPNSSPVPKKLPTPQVHNGYLTLSDRYRLYDGDSQYRFNILGDDNTFGITSPSVSPCQISSSDGFNIDVLIADNTYVISAMDLALDWAGQPWLGLTVYLNTLSGNSATLSSRRNAEMHALNGNIDKEEVIDIWLLWYINDLAFLEAEYQNTNWLHRMWNKLMHSINGNMEIAFGDEMKKVRKSRKQSSMAKLLALGRRFGATKQGMQWLVMAIDPFHDEEEQYAGLPDGNAVNVTLQTINQSAVIAAPSSGTWDVSIVAFPQLGPLTATPQKFYQATQNSINGNAGDGILGVTGNVAGGCFGINWIATSNPNSNISWVMPANTGIYPSATPVDIPASFVKSPMRVIAAGYEIYNTTAEIYQQGNMTNYRLGSPDIRAATSTLCIVSNSFGYMSVALAPAPPNNQATAMQLATSRAWKAKEGVYMPLVLTDAGSMPTTSSNRASYAYFDTGPTDTVVAIKPLGTSTVSGNTFTVSYPVNDNYTAMDIAGSYLTGLSEQTTLFLVARWIIETKAAPNDALVTTTRSSYPRDAAALELYSVVTSKFLGGCPVRENGFGEWFTKAVDWVADRVSDVGGALGNKWMVGGAKLAKKAIALAKSSPSKEEVKQMAAKAVAKREKAIEDKVVQRVERDMK